ncbi:MAG: hypothetical protein LIO87_06695 [Eubacterium sp.]|nr:hypothetical protein [Eubacterium sp.]MCC8173180.1 hypothetical protein [Odoribacter sp.]
MKQAILKPTISINVKDSLIVIHKNVLRVLGSPKFIQILVNPDDKSIVACRSVETDHLAHLVNPEILSQTKKTFRIHSYSLLYGLHKIYPKWSKDVTYKLSGKFISNLNVVKFNMEDSVISSRRDRSCTNEQL